MSNLSKEIMDKINAEAMRLYPERPMKNSQAYVDTWHSLKQDCFFAGGKFAALHYSAIIEEKDKEIDQLKKSLSYYKQQYALLISRGGDDL